MIWSQTVCWRLYRNITNIFNSLLAYFWSPILFTLLTGTPRSISTFGFIVVVNWCNKSGDCSNRSGARDFMAASNWSAQPPGTPYQVLGSPLKKKGLKNQIKLISADESRPWLCKHGSGYGNLHCIDSLKQDIFGNGFLLICSLLLMMKEVFDDRDQLYSPHTVGHLIVQVYIKIFQMICFAKEIFLEHRRDFYMVQCLSHCCLMYSYLFKFISIKSFL